VVVSPFRLGEAVENFAAEVERADQVRVADPGLCLGLLGDQLDVDAVAAVGGSAGLGGGDHVLVAALGQGVPGGHRPGPNNDLAVAGLVTDGAGGTAGRLGCGSHPEVVLQTADEQGQPAGGDQQ